MLHFYFVIIGLFFFVNSAFSQLNNITEVTLTFTPDQGTPLVFTATDEGNGLMADAFIELMESTDYSISIQLNDATGDLNNELLARADSLLFFYILSGSVFNGDVQIVDTDNQGLPLGLTGEFTSECTLESDLEGELRIVLQDLSGQKTLQSELEDGISLFDVSWIVKILDDPEAPPCENEEEIITDFILTWVPQDGGDTVFARAQDPDGEGPLDLVILDDIELIENYSYVLHIRIRNEVEGEEITDEIKQEDDEHLFFFGWTEGVFDDPPGDGNIDNRADAVNYLDMDENNLPVGLSTRWNTASGIDPNSMFRVILKHQPGVKSENSTVEDGGTDIDLTWSINTVITDIQEKALVNEALKIYPNPVRENFIWHLNSVINQKTELVVFDQWGRRVAYYQKPQSNIQVGYLHEGVYFVQLRSGEQVWTQRMVKY